MLVLFLLCSFTAYKCGSVDYLESSDARMIIAESLQYPRKNIV